MVFTVSVIAISGHSRDGILLDLKIKIFIKFMLIQFVFVPSSEALLLYIFIMNFIVISIRQKCTSFYACCYYLEAQWHGGQHVFVHAEGREFDSWLNKVHPTLHPFVVDKTSTKIVWELNVEGLELGSTPDPDICYILPKEPGSRKQDGQHRP